MYNRSTTTNDRNVREKVLFRAEDDTEQTRMRQLHSTKC